MQFITVKLAEDGALLYINVANISFMRVSDENETWSIIGLIGDTILVVADEPLELVVEKIRRAHELL